MKKIIQWLAKVFNAEIDGNLKINGKLEVKGDVICYKTNK